MLWWPPRHRGAREAGVRYDRLGIIDEQYDPVLLPHIGVEVLFQILQGGYGTGGKKFIGGLVPIGPAHLGQEVLAHIRPGKTDARGSIIEYDDIAVPEEHLRYVVLNFYKNKFVLIRLVG